jgi:hypothetical protein
MTWREILDEIKSFGDVQVDCKWFIVPSTFEWIKINNETINLIKKSGINPSKSQESMRIKQNGITIINILRNQPDKICKRFTSIREEKFSIYPLKI